MDIKGKTAIITGASSGIGEAIALRLGEAGANTALFARRDDKLKHIAHRINDAGGNATAVRTDITSEENVKRSVAETLKNFKRIDILINNAGLGIFNRVEEMQFYDWKQQIDVMLNGLFLMTKYAIPHIYEQKSGHVITIGSLWGIKGCHSCTGYTTAKFGVRGFMESLREEAREHNVKVTGIMPGTVDTPFFEKAGYDKGQDMSKVLQAEDIAQTVLYALNLPQRAVAEEIIIQALHPPY